MRILLRTIKIITVTILITSAFVTAEESSTRASKPSIPERPEKRAGESDAAFNSRMRQWETEVRRISAEYDIKRITAKNPENSASTSGLPERPVQREGESDISFASRLRNWEADVRRINAGAPSIPERPEQRPGESDSSYQNRLRQWETAVRRITEENPQTSTSDSGIPDRPVRRSGESDAAYNNRLRAWEAQVRGIASAQATQKKDEELIRLKQELQKLTEQVSRSSRTGSFVDTGSENMLVIPSGEIETGELLAINEDMNVMSRILTIELNREITSSSKVEWLFSDGRWIPVEGSYNTILGQSINILSSMYLQGYGALFLIKVNFPLSAPPETQEQPEEGLKKDVDEVWEQTRQQISEQQRTSMTSLLGSSTPEDLVLGVPEYNAQKVENLKKSFIQALKHASNIRALQPDESVILRISEKSTFKSPVTAILGDRYFIQGTWVKKENLADYITLLPPNAIVIRAKKSDIDAFSKGELDFNQFREKVQVFSYPLIGGNTGAIR